MTDRERCECLEKLMDQYGTILLRICSLQLKDASLAEDVVQDTFLKAYKALDTFRFQSSELTWLIRIAMNTCRDYQRTGWFKWLDRRITPEELPERGAEDALPDDEVLQAVMSLRAPLRAAVLVRYYQQMTVEECAHALNISAATVKRRLKAANQILHIKLERWYFDE